MYCMKCGNQLPGDASFCLKCGVPQKASIGNAAKSRKRKKGSKNVIRVKLHKGTRSAMYIFDNIVLPI
jgi:uncharacterized membrane protein YvbJ